MCRAQVDVPDGYQNVGRVLQDLITDETKHTTSFTGLLIGPLHTLHSFLHGRYNDDHHRRKH